MEQPPAFPRETPETIKEYIRDKYLLPRLDEDVFSPQNAGKQWEFEWFDRAKIQLEPSIPRSVVVPSWEMPFRRKGHKSELKRWEPESLEVCNQSFSRPIFSVYMVIYYFVRYLVKIFRLLLFPNWE